MRISRDKILGLNVLCHKLPQGLRAPPPPKANIIKWNGLTLTLTEISQKINSLNDENFNKVVNLILYGDKSEAPPMPPCKPVKDNVNSPAHYTQGGIECIDALQSATVNKSGIEAVCVANVIKYLWRYETKNGVEDVKKAHWYLNRLIGVLEKGGDK